MDLYVAVLTGLVALAEKAPRPEDVKAGWGAFAIFAGLAIAVGLLGWSLTRHLKKTQANAEAGVFDEDAAPDA